MLRMNTITYEAALQLKTPAAPAWVHLPRESVAIRHEQESESAIDDALAASFPASDPPGWNPGLARPVPVDRLRSHAPETGTTEANDVTTWPPVIDVPRRNGSEQTLLQALVSFGGAAGIALLVPFVILVVGLPFALAIRGLLELFLWLFHAIR